MRKFSVAKQFEVNPQKSERVTTVMRMFGVGIDRLKGQRTTHACTVEVNDGDIVYITGPSGAGKSVLLREMQAAVADDDKIVIEQIALPADKSAIDCVGGTGTIDGLSMLSYAGLSDVFCMLNAPANLSEGQKYRFRLACALASGRKFVFADEFCSNLDRITAGVIAYNVRRFAKHNGVTFFLASAHEDILADLQPDVLVVKNFSGEAEVTYKSKK
ncbi:MAG: ATP-binding cassette domain-containing protein [Sedimentisphaerales bacterium]